ncbi:MAG TPA: 50S ribosomal protein L30 [bacterium]|jgi:large subunit ribosomal protein L30|nr:50S ribosomal protein L30 [bacterium]
MSDLKIQLTKSLNGRLPKHVRIAEALGLRKIRQTVIRPDTPIIRGMVEKIGYLVEIKK